MASQYAVGATVRTTVTFTDDDGAAADPTAVLCKLEVPAGTETTYTYGEDAEIVKDSTGVYHLDYKILAVGTHVVRWEGTGALDAAAEEQFIGEESAFY